jgi:hypothetical protein
VIASKEIINLHQFFTKLIYIVNIVGVSCNCSEELRVANAAEIAYIIKIDELENKSELNQIVTLQHARDTHSEFSLDINL